LEKSEGSDKSEHSAAVQGVRPAAALSGPIATLVTGAAGRVGQAACRSLLERGHPVRALDIRKPDHVEDSIVADICQFAEVCRAMEQIEVVVHLAATPDEADFASQLLPNNIVGLYNILEGARTTGVRRVVLASSGQVVMGHQGPWPITPQMPYSPRNWYASAKVFAEVAGQVYAHQHGMSVIAARLGWCPRDRQHARELAHDELGKDVYLSPADAGRFFVCAVEATLDLRYCIVFATSRPVRRARYDLSPSRDLLGYEPRDTWPQGTEIATRSP
jgi:nucleoside-diphosphate-sugar epimerase